MQEVDKTRLLILYGSQTGNAQDVAERVAREARLLLFAPSIMPMDAYPLQHLPDEKLVVLVTATTGQGDPPDNMRKFWRMLLRKNLPGDLLAGLQYAVFGLGDSGYVKYNVAAKKLDRRLAALGAEPLLERGLGDDQHPSGYEASLDPWLQQLWAVLRQRCPLPPGVQQPVLDEAALLQLGPPKYKRVTAADHFQDTRHIEFDLQGSGFDYQPGDLLAVFPRTPAADVEAALLRLGLDGDAWLRVEPAEQQQQQQQQQQDNGTQHANGSSSAAGAVCEATARAIVQGVLDLSGCSPRRYLFQVLSHFVSNAMQQKRLQYFATAEGRDDLYRYNQRERRSLLEVLQDFSSAAPPLERLLEAAPLLSPRQFSLASSPAAHPGRAAILVAVVAWATPTKRLRKGLLTSCPSADFYYRQEWGQLMQQQALQQQHGLIVAFSRHSPQLDQQQLLDMLQQQQQQQPGNAAASSAADGAGAATEQAAAAAAAAAAVAAAEVRPPGSRVYVTHKLREQGAMVWQLLQQGAWVYVSGSAEKMPAAVVSALEDVAQQHGGLTREAAAKYIRQLELSGRYHVEAWS
ncbi:hypothetical protein OEZ85_006782 [Tetradesmus obliquus]|uniref:NADPH-dependent FMN and FAD-containing oxidoreductase n=1 Tax=Tetradesmus obliquus TaxID=3088 RepID=A0ABY8TW47_TETOB|nr:hypothetical protein OEZ85_006782 [Tetradesmus obliquus]